MSNLDCDYSGNTNSIILDFSHYRKSVAKKFLDAIEDETVILENSSQDTQFTSVEQYEMMGQIADCLNRIEKKQDSHHNCTVNNHQELLYKLESLESENEFFREELVAINSPKKLRRYASMSAVFSLVSIGFYEIGDVIILNPLLSYLLAAVSSGFILMARCMEKED